MMNFIQTAHEELTKEKETQIAPQKLKPTAKNIREVAEKQARLHTRNIVRLYLENYLDENDDPSVQGFLDYAAVEEEHIGEETADELRDTEEALMRDQRKEVFGR